MSLIFGGLVGLSLGLTGGGGSILTVPLLLYGLGLSFRDAVMVSLAVVGLTAVCLGTVCPVGICQRMQNPPQDLLPPRGILCAENDGFLRLPHKTRDAFI